ncbi:hypothetical protein N9541_03040 [Flavobacteriaceae bacterium]|jgi:hypothetical protein|nr:hypothetical protein [Flavobacteriaceae bacterium]|tara:strand:- start:630 stop:884 length:255 start_codon:yes stop_codon:yes gene_type:complete
MNKVSISKLIKHSSLIEINLNEIHKVLSVGKKADESTIKDLVKDIEGWRECLVELDFYISSNYQLNMKSDNYEYDDTSKEVIIY